MQDLPTWTPGSWKLKIPAETFIPHIWWFQVVRVCFVCVCVLYKGRLWKRTSFVCWFTFVKIQFIVQFITQMLLMFFCELQHCKYPDASLSSEAWEESVAAMLPSLCRLSLCSVKYSSGLVAALWLWGFFVINNYSSAIYHSEDYYSTCGTPLSIRRPPSGVFFWFFFIFWNRVDCQRSGKKEKREKKKVPKTHKRLRRTLCNYTRQSANF